MRQLTDWKRFLQCGIKAWIAVCVQRTVKCVHLMERDVRVAVKSESSRVLWVVLCSVCSYLTNMEHCIVIQCIIYCGVT